MLSVMEAVQLNDGLAIKLSITVRLMKAVSFDIYSRTPPVRIKLGLRDIGMCRKCSLFSTKIG